VATPGTVPLHNDSSSTAVIPLLSERVLGNDPAAASALDGEVVRACKWQEEDSSCKLDWGVYGTVIQSNAGVHRDLLGLRDSTYDCMVNAANDTGGRWVVQRCSEDAAYAQCKTWTAGRWEGQNIRKANEGILLWVPASSPFLVCT
jgi:hypothetical protein